MTEQERADPIARERMYVGAAVALGVSVGAAVVYVFGSLLDHGLLGQTVRDCARLDGGEERLPAAKPQGAGPPPS